MTTSPSGLLAASQPDLPSASPEALQGRITELSAAFERNVSRATASYSKHISDETLLAGIPAHEHAAAHRAAERAGLSGSLLSLSSECYRAVLCHATDRKLRQELYEAFVTRSSDRGPQAGEHDNTAIVQDLLMCRHQLARQAGLSDYAELACQRTGLFASTDQVERFLLEQSRARKPRAAAQLEALWTFAKAQGAPKGFSRWDLPYYATLLQQQEPGWEEHTLSEYLPFAAVCSGLEQLSKILFGITCAPLTASTACCQRYALQSADGRALGQIEVALGSAADPEPERALSIRLDPAEPLVVLRCRLSPLNAESACLTPAQLKQLFSDWAHSLTALLQHSQHLPMNVTAEVVRQLTAAVAARIGLSPAVLGGFARHHQSQAPLPASICEELQHRHELHAEISAIDQVERALFALRVHRDYVPADKATRLRSHVLDTLAQVRREIGVLPPSYWERMPNTALDIFGAERATQLWDDVFIDYAAQQLLGAASDPSHAPIAARVSELLMLREARELPRAIGAVKSHSGTAAASAPSNP